MIREEEEEEEEDKEREKKEKNWRAIEGISKTGGADVVIFKTGG